MGHARFRVDRAATGRNHFASDILRQQHLLLDITKGQITIFVTDLLQGFTFTDLNADIRINEIEPQLFGQQNTQSTFSCTRHTD